MILHFTDINDSSRMKDVNPAAPLPVAIQGGAGGSASVSTEEVEITGIPGGSNTLSGSSEKLNGISTATPAKWVWLYPDADNAGDAFWGDATNVASPIPASGISFPIDDVDKVRINGTADDVVYWRYGTVG